MSEWFKKLRYTIAYLIASDWIDDLECDECDVKKETAREIFAEIDDLFFDKFLMGNITASLFDDKYAELQKKYMGEDANVPTKADGATDTKDGRKKTNFDRIKGMTVDEMSTFICGIYDNDEDLGKFINGEIVPEYGEDGILKWLESEVET